MTKTPSLRAHNENGHARGTLPVAMAHYVVEHPEKTRKGPQPRIPSGVQLGYYGVVAGFLLVCCCVVPGPWVCSLVDWCWRLLTGARPCWLMRRSWAVGLFLG